MLRKEKLDWNIAKDIFYCPQRVPPPSFLIFCNGKYLNKSKKVPLLHFSALCDIFREKISSFFQKNVLRFLSLRYSADFRRSRPVNTHSWNRACVSIERCRTRRVRIKFIFCLLVGVSKPFTGPGRAWMRPGRKFGPGSNSVHTNQHIHIVRQRLSHSREARSCIQLINDKILNEHAII